MKYVMWLKGMEGVTTPYVFLEFIFETVPEKKINELHNYCYRNGFNFLKFEVFNTKEKMIQKLTEYIDKKYESENIRKDMMNYYLNVINKL